jgi:hypothetical protein
VPGYVPYKEQSRQLSLEPGKILESALFFYLLDRCFVASSKVWLISLLPDNQHLIEEIELQDTFVNLTFPTAYQAISSITSQYSNASPSEE